MADQLEGIQDPEGGEAPRAPAILTGVEEPAAQAEGEAAAFWQDPFSSTYQKAAIVTLLKRGFQEDADVQKLLEWLHGPIVGTQRICLEEDHVAPFTFLADVMTGRTTDYIAWANRSGSKSYLAGMIAWALSSSLPQLETTILGGSLKQAEKSYKGMKDLWALTGLQDDFLIAEPAKGYTGWINGSSVAVLTASTKSVRGPHPQHLIMDEVDEMAEEVYTAALSQPQSKHGIDARLGQLSTAHRTGGMMDMALEQAMASGTPIYKWCIWECLEACRDYACSTCPLSAWCPGPQMKRANGYYKISDFVKKLATMSLITLMTEWFCRRVGQGNLVYGEQFDEKIHARGDIPGFDPGRQVSLSIDWGGTNPFSVGAWQHFDMGWIRVNTVYQPGTNQGLIAECRTRPWWPNAREGIADPSRPDLISEWLAAGIPIFPADNDVDKGLEAVRRALKPVIGAPTMWINRAGNKAWLKEMNGYCQRNGKPIKVNDHAMDETRYFAMWKLGAAILQGRVFHAGQRLKAAAKPPRPGRPAHGSVPPEELAQARQAAASGIRRAPAGPYTPKPEAAAPEKPWARWTTLGRIYTPQGQDGAAQDVGQAREASRASSQAPRELAPALPGPGNAPQPAAGAVPRPAPGGKPEANTPEKPHPAAGNIPSASAAAPEGRPNVRDSQPASASARPGSPGIGQASAAAAQGRPTVGRVGEGSANVGPAPGPVTGRNSRGETDPRGSTLGRERSAAAPERRPGSGEGRPATDGIGQPGPRAGQGQASVGHPAQGSPREGAALRPGAGGTGGIPGKPQAGQPTLPGPGRSPSVGPENANIEKTPGTSPEGQPGPGAGQLNGGQNVGNLKGRVFIRGGRQEAIRRRIHNEAEDDD